MLASTIDLVRRALPDDLPFDYFADRESPWLLARRMTAPTRVADLRAGPAGFLLDRPLVRPAVAASGGVLDPTDLDAIAAGRIAVRRPAQAALQIAWSEPWRDYVLAFAAWGVGQRWGGQMSRLGGNLVVRLGFPSDHAALLGRLRGPAQRHKFECGHHPIRRTGAPTLAWARLDFDLGGEAMLIEELQTDWLRYARRQAEDRERTAPRSRDARLARDYATNLAGRYGREWSRALLLAVLMLARDEFGCSRVFLHRAETGTVMKRIHGRPPPVSLYTDLPRRFGFAETAEAPDWLERPRRKDLQRLRRVHDAVFWLLDLKGPAVSPAWGSASRAAPQAAPGTA